LFKPSKALSSAYLKKDSHCW